ncbi:hypothetical protein AOLI_G00129540 [Acnodon oligacanthus]
MFILHIPAPHHIGGTLFFREAILSALLSALGECVWGIRRQITNLLSRRTGVRKQRKTDLGAHLMEFIVCWLRSGWLEPLHTQQTSVTWRGSCLTLLHTKTAELGVQLLSPVEMLSLWSEDTEFSLVSLSDPLAHPAWP